MKDKEFKMKLLDQYWRKHRNFIIYIMVGGAVTITNIILLYIFIDIFNIPTLISSTVVVGGLFILKYFVYKWTGFTQ